MLTLDEIAAFNYLVEVRKQHLELGVQDAKKRVFDDVDWSDRRHYEMFNLFCLDDKNPHPLPIGR